MAKKYEIELHVNTTQSDDSTARSSQVAGRVERAYKAVGDAQEKAAKRGADAFVFSALKLDAQASKLSAKIAAEASKAATAQERESKRAVESLIRDSKRVAAAQERANQAQERASKKALDSLINDAKKVADAQDREAQRATNARIKAAQKEQDRLAAMGGRLLTDAEARAKGEAAIFDRFNQRKIDAATKLADKERLAGMSIRDRLKEQFQGFVESINPAALAMTAAVAGIAFVVRDLAAEWGRVASGIRDSIEFTNKYREMLPENASTKGNVGDVTTETRENLDLRAKTLQTAQESVSFEGAMLNTGAIGIGRQITQDEFNKLKVAGGQLQVAQGADAQTQGELLGRLPALMKPKLDARGKEIPVTADEAIGRLGKIKTILDQGGAKYNVGSTQLLKNSSLSQNGAFGSIEEQAALQSAYSLSNREQAGEMTQWLVRATTGNLQDEKVSAYYKRIGVKDGMKALDIARLVSADLAKQEASNKNFDAFNYLPKQGFANQEDLKSLVGYRAIDRSGDLKKMMDLAAAPDDAGSIRDAVAAFRAGPLAQTRSRQVTDDAAQFSFKRDHQTADEFRRQAFNLLVSTGTLHGKYEENQSYFTKSRGPQRIHTLSRQLLEQSAKKAGVDISDIDIGSYSLFDSQAAIDGRFQAAIDRIRAAGVDPFTDAREYQAKATRANLGQAQIAERAPRAGLVAADRRDRAIRPGIPRPGIVAPVGLMPGGADQVLVGAINQLVALTQQQIQIQQGQDRKLAEANRQRDQQGRKAQGVPPPLPVQGPGRIATR